jgi:hypothetical protein
LPVRTNRFVGREKYLKDIESAFSNENKKIIVLSSFPGTGKTTLANEFGYRFTEKSFNNHLVYWIKSDGNNSDYYFENFAKFDLHIDLNQNNDKQFIIRQIKNKLNRTTENILFIFDNCDNYQSIEDYVVMISTLKHFKILITSRNSILIEKMNPDESKQIFLEPFNENECIQFIMNSFSIKKEESKGLLKLLETQSDELKRPNDLIKLIAYVKLNLKAFQKITIKFINELNENRRESKTHISDDYIFELIIKKNLESWQVLKCSSYLDPDFIPIEIYSDLFGFDLNKLEAIVTNLKEISIISVDDKDEENVGLKIHRTIKNKVDMDIINFMSGKDLMGHLWKHLDNMIIHNVKHDLWLKDENEWRLPY